MVSTGLVLGIIGGLGLGILIFVPALLYKKKLDTAKLEEYNKQKNELLDLVKYFNDKANEAREEATKCELEAKEAQHTRDIQAKELNELRRQEYEVRNSLTNLSETEQKIKANMEKSIEERSEALSKEYQAAEDEYRQEYITATQEMAIEFSTTMANKRAELHSLENAISDKQMIYDTILEMEQRKAKEEAERDFYRLNIPKEDLEEIIQIREITPYLRNPEVLNKVLWTYYYQKPYQDLIARLFKDRKPTGIYKITCLSDDKVYIGQSVNVPNRFSEHIKRGLGAEPATRNRLYPAMKKWGVENFIFELLEEVPREKLDERERYWIQFFHSAETGLNGNKGVKG